MKTLEEIENLSLEELERNALEAPVTVPDGLEQRLRQTLAAREIAEAARPRPVRRLVPFAVAAAAVAAVVLLPQRGPKDSFDDPLLAYAEVEKAFQTISDKMSVGMDLAREAGSAAELPKTILNKTQSK